MKILQNNPSSTFMVVQSPLTDRLYKVYIVNGGTHNEHIATSHILSSSQESSKETESSDVQKLIDLAKKHAPAIVNDLRKMYGK